MALTTIAFCHSCKWRSSALPIQPKCAGAPCPTCGAGVSALHYDPTFTGTIDGQPYNEMAAAAAHLAQHGISTVGPATAVAIPPHGAIASPPALPISVS